MFVISFCLYQILNSTEFIKCLFKISFISGSISRYKNAKMEIFIFEFLSRPKVARIKVFAFSENADLYWQCSAVSWLQKASRSDSIGSLNEQNSINRKHDSWMIVLYIILSFPLSSLKSIEELAFNAQLSVVCSAPLGQLIVSMQ